MKHIYKIVFLIIVITFFACSKSKVFTESDIQIIPKPAELKISEEH